MSIRELLSVARHCAVLLACVLTLAVIRPEAVGPAAPGVPAVPTPEASSQSHPAAAPPAQLPPTRGPVRHAAPGSGPSPTPPHGSVLGSVLDVLDLDRVPLGIARDGNATAHALSQQWTYFGQGDQESLYGYPQVVSARGAGLPEPPSGDHVVKLFHPAGDPGTHHKLYKLFTPLNWPGRLDLRAPADGTPADVSGRYVTYLYIPSAQLRLSPRGWVVLVQFKEGYVDSAGTATSVPSWWIGLNDFTGRGPVLDLSRAFGTHDGPKLDARPYLDRWVRFELRLYQGDRVEAYVDGTLLDIGHAAEFPVGRRFYRGTPTDDGAAVVTQPNGWTYGAGNYSNPDDAAASTSLVYVGPTTVRAPG